MTDKKEHKSKASLFYLYGQRNAGDAAIGIGALSFLIKEGFSVTAFSRWPKSSPEYQSDFDYYSSYFNSVVIEGSPFLFKRVRNLMLLLYYYAASFVRLFFSSSSRKIKHTVRDSDLVVLNGGNLLRCQSLTDFIRLVGFLYPLCLARYYNVPYVILPQSTAEINTMGKMLMRYVFPRARGIWVREKESLSKFTVLFPNVNFIFAPDMAFHIPCTETITDQDIMDEDYINVAMTVRSHTIGDAKELEIGKRDEISETLSYLIDRISSRFKIRLTLVVQCDKDLQITTEVKNKIKVKKLANLQECVIFDTRNNHSLLSFYSKMDLLIGMRLHSIILALTSGTVCAGYFERSWGLKNPGLLGLFGLPVSFCGEKPDLFAMEILDAIESRKSLSKKISGTIAEQRKDFHSSFTFAIRKK